MANDYDVAIVGAGFTGLTAAYKLSRQGLKVCVVEADSEVGGLAGTFEFAQGIRVEKFYHHWFNSDTYIPALARELGHEQDIVTLPSRNGMYYAGRRWRLTTPIDLIRFSPLPLWDRIRLGVMVLRVRRISNWKSLEHLTVREWLEPIIGKNAYQVMWEPLIKSKFSIHAEEVNAVWFWKKLVLRGSTRDKTGGEELAYFRGGFGRLAELMAEEIRENGGQIFLNTAAMRIHAENGKVRSLETERGLIHARQYLLTPSFPIIANLLEGACDEDYISKLKRVKYLGNMCLVLRLNRSLSDLYWLNVNDPGFPFVGVIEHTNFDPPINYGGSHIVYLSKYVSLDDSVWSYSEEEYFKFALSHLKRMFPDLQDDWVLDWRMWRSAYAQPITERGYSDYVPGELSPLDNLHIATMAQVYPEDRGTNYAVREGNSVAKRIASKLGK